MLEGCFVTCYLQENNFQLSAEVLRSKAPGVCQREVQSNFNGHLRNYQSNRCKSGKWSKNWDTE